MTKKQFFLAFLITLLAALVILSLSCNPLKKTQRYLHEHPEFSADYCAEQFPVKDSVVVRDSLVIDTLTFIDQVPSADTTLSGDTVTIVKTNTVYKTITKTLRKDSIIYRRDAAEEERLSQLLKKCEQTNITLVNSFAAKEKQAEEWKGKAKKRWWWILILIGAGVAYAGLRIKKSLSVKKVS